MENIKKTKVYLKNIKVWDVDYAVQKRYNIEYGFIGFFQSLYKTYEFKNQYNSNKISGMMLALVSDREE